MNIDYAVVSEQGLREDMEDTYCVAQPFAGHPQHLFAGVFDGHNGSCAAQYAARELPVLFAQKLAVTRSVRGALVRTYEEISETLKYQRGGACAATLFLRPPTLFFANAGDCEIVLFQNGALQTLSVNHRIGNRAEAKRVRARGGVVESGYVWSGSNGLQMCRTLGDAGFRSVGVIATPDCGHIQVAAPATLLIGTDGLFDRVSREAIANILCAVKTTLAQAARLKGLVESVTPYDNYTFIVVSLEP